MNFETPPVICKKLFRLVTGIIRLTHTPFISLKMKLFDKESINDPLESTLTLGNISYYNIGKYSSLY